MSLSMYKVSAPTFVRGLKVMADLLRKAEAYAEESGKVPESLLSARLVDVVGRGFAIGLAVGVLLVTDSDAGPLTVVGVLAIGSALVRWSE